MDAANPARGKDLQSRKRRQSRRGRHGRRAPGSLDHYGSQVIEPHLLDLCPAGVWGLGEQRELRVSQPDGRNAVDDADSGGDRALVANNVLTGASGFEIEGPGQTVGDHGGLERDHRSALRKCFGDVPGDVNFAICIIYHSRFEVESSGVRPLPDLYCAGVLSAPLRRVVSSLILSSSVPFSWTSIVRE